MRCRVVKVGGSALADPGWLGRFATSVAGAADRLVVVHGGGPEMDDVSMRLGVAVERVAGLRVTTPEALDVAVMVLSGRTNKRLVSALLDAGVDAVGLSGEDGGLLLAEVADDGALGRVGNVVRVRVELPVQLLGAGVTPVISPVSRGTSGGALNVNADDAASAVAVALGAEELLFLTDVDGVRAGGLVRSDLDVAEAASLVTSGEASGGMAVKLDAATRAIEGGVPMVRIGGLGALTDRHAGTRVLARMAVVQ